jgi:hypothetical protein
VRAAANKREKAIRWNGLAGRAVRLAASPRRNCNGPPSRRPRRYLGARPQPAKERPADEASHTAAGRALATPR